MIIAFSANNYIKSTGVKTIISARAVLLGNENDLCANMCNNIIETCSCTFCRRIYFYIFYTLHEQ